ncbi:MAG: phosphate ABC transporter permease subunit PstC [Chloracidobacterium sp.]|uniref:phosphate ABC transporter permease subunit PstC n=1 Tax=Chloracidobacterium validum TaxID=2821543 RepID=UPI001FE87F80|nr:phosphate ABC transporter permease subunit PstC [Chloracidobacterium validum]
MATVTHQPRRPWARWREHLIEWLLAGAALVAVLTTLGIAAVLVGESLPLFRQVSLWSFLTDTAWTPLFAEPRFGIGVLLAGTATSSLVALAVAIPSGTILAMYLSEFAAGQLRESIKPVLELLAGVPTVVLGYFALYTVTPFLQKLWPALPSFNLLSAGLVMGIMIVPYVASLSEDALRAVPMSLREGAYALGATRLQTAWQVVFPAAFSGIAASYVLGVSRAIGETMIVAIAAGQQPRLTLNPFEPAATATTYIVQVAKGDIPHGGLSYRTIFAVALVLFLLTLAFNLAADWVRRRQRLRGLGQ